MYKYFMLFLISLTKISEIKTSKTFAYLANMVRYQFESFAYKQVSCHCRASQKYENIMKQLVKNIFASLGFIFLIYGIYNFVKRERITESYWENIKKVKVGMNLNEARAIIGDLEYEYWTQDDKSAEITVQIIDGKPIYTLEYDMVFGGSDNPKIYFNPNTLKVTKVINGE